MPKPHGSNNSNDSNDSSFPDALRSHVRRFRTHRAHSSGDLHQRGSSVPSRAVVPVVESSVDSWSRDDHPGSLPRERGNSGHSGRSDQSDHTDRGGRSPLTPQYHWHQDTHHHHYYPSAQHASPEPQPSPQPQRQAAFALPAVPQPRLSHAGGCLAVSLVLLGAFLTFLVMLMGLALAGQVLMLR